MVKQFSPITIGRPDLTQDADRRMALMTQRGRTTDPGTLIDIDLRQLGDKYETLFDDAVRAGRDPTTIQAEYNRAKAGLNQDKTRLELARRREQAGELLPGTASQFGNELIGQPSQPTPRRPSAAGMSLKASNDLADEFETFAKNNLINPPGKGFWARNNYINPEVVKDSILIAWEIQNLDDSYNAAKRPGFITAVMKGFSRVPGAKKALEKLLSKGEGGEVEIIRRFGPSSYLMDVFNKKLNNRGISPLGKSIKSQLAKVGAQGWIPSQAYQQTPEQFQQPTQQQLPTVTNDADYDALPSGVEFIGPDGAKRRKP